jgi:gliding motility-associated-like protein
MIVPNVSDHDLTILAGATTNNASVLEFDFIPNGETLSFRYVFGSEEYHQYVCSSFNDAFGFFLSGPGIDGPFSNNAINIALIPGTDDPVTINSVNNGFGNNPDDPNCPASNPEFFNDNTGGQTVVYNGLTVVLTATAQVQCGETYHIKLAVADASDQILDSGVFLEAGSFSSTPFVPELEPGPGIAGNVIYESCFPVQLNFVRTGCEVGLADTMFIAAGGTSTPGVDYVPEFPEFIVFEANETIVPYFFTVVIDEDDNPETIVLTLTSTLTCADEFVINEFEFIIDDAPELIAQGGFAEIPCTNFAELAPQVSGGFGFYSYQWSNGDTGPVSIVSPTQQTTYTVTITDTCGISTQTVFIVAIEPLNPLVMTIIGESTLMEACDEAQINFIRPFGTLGDLTVVLEFSGEATNGADVFLPDTIIIPEGSINFLLPVAPVEDGIPEGEETFTVTGTVMDPCGQTATASVTFTFIDAPLLEVFTEDILVECGPDSIPLIASGSGGVGSLSYEWFDGTQGDTYFVQIQVPGVYEVTVIDECDRTATGLFNVELDCDIIIPNVFTPNNDGVNDFWVIDGIRSLENTVRVFNRWGQIVFEASNYQNNWRGTGLPDGTYYYEVKVPRRDEVHTGHLTILSSGRR